MLPTAALLSEIVFDAYGTNDLKFVALDVVAQKVLVGHITPRNTWVVDATVARTIVAGADHTLKLVMKGTSVSVVVNGSLALSHAFNSPIVDGMVGTLSRGGTTSFDSFRLLTNDTALAAGLAMPATSAARTTAMASTASLDTNADGVVSPIDALLVINELNKEGLAVASPARLNSSLACDTNRDGSISPLDALLVINQLNGPSRNFAAMPMHDEWLAAIAADVESSSRRSRDKLAGVDESKAEVRLDRVFETWL
jgi:hypothetical protein